MKYDPKVQKDHNIFSTFSSSEELTNLPNDRNKTNPTASFKTDSPKTNAKICGSTRLRVKTDRVDTGSVADNNAPKVKASIQVYDVTTFRRKPMRMQEVKVPTVAKQKIGIILE
mmetsp:Transcript_7724/g.11806  ORF Transcript_7724/g.11806 Transcript_7724/m.11806 type:complete len:114 (-) Transcript_7724:369-710(-)